jgi:hypothetical protein
MISIFYFFLSDPGYDDNRHQETYPYLNEYGNFLEDNIERLEFQGTSAGLVVKVILVAPTEFPRHGLFGEYVII